jgi:hypothetical protein
MVKEMPLEGLVHLQLLVLVLAVEEATVQAETVLLEKFGLGTESNGLFCKHR